MNRPRQSSEGYPNNVTLGVPDSEGCIRGSSGQHRGTSINYMLPSNPLVEFQSTHAPSEPPAHRQTFNHLDAYDSSLGTNYTMQGNEYGPFSASSTTSQIRSASRGGSWSNRKPTRVNDNYESQSQANLLTLPMETCTYNSAEEGRSQPRRKASVFSYMWNLSRGTPSDIPSDVSYPSDLKEHDLFAPGNAIDRKGRGSYVSRTGLDHNESLRQRPGLTARAGSEVGKALYKVSSVIAPQERMEKRNPVIVHNVRSK